ncbi:MAG: hypothetical protein ACRDT9_03880 [Agromyces sp.]
MSENTKLVSAAIGVVLVAIVSGIWLAGLGAWGLVVYVAVLSFVIVWLLVTDALRNSAARSDDTIDLEYETVHWLKAHGL